MTFIAAALTAAMLLVIWFETNAFVEYTAALGLSKFLHIGEYQAFTGSCDASSFLSYPKFLFEFFPSFLTRLLKCPICVSVWCGFAACLIFPPFLHCLAVSFVGLNCYLLFTKLVGSSHA